EQLGTSTRSAHDPTTYTYPTWEVVPPQQPLEQSFQIQSEQSLHIPPPLQLQTRDQFLRSYLAQAQVAQHRA
ncbi:unnamed protein product, partial [Amoebophrya sp. A25]